MHRISPARIFNDKSGFSLLEVIVAVAVVAMTVAAASSSILVSRRIGSSASFYQDALYEAESLQAGAYGIIPDPAEGTGNRQLTVDEEMITTDPEGQIRNWLIYSIRSPDDRRVSFAIHSESTRPLN